MSVKLQPGVTFSELVQPEAEVLETLDYLAPALSKLGMAYVCCSSLNGEPYYKFAGTHGLQYPGQLCLYMRNGRDGPSLALAGVAIQFVGSVI